MALKNLFLARMCASILRRKHQSVTFEPGTKWNFSPCSYSEYEAGQKLCCI